MVELAQSFWRGRNRTPSREYLKVVGFPLAARAHFPRQLKDSWTPVLLVLFQAESAGISSQIGRI